MSQYLQTSTANPYGRRPWATRLYTGFDNFGFLKQPQNTIIREDVNMRPEIYRPPEMKKPKPGLSGVMLVGGSGRILRRRSSGLGLIANGGGSFTMLPARSISVAPTSQMIRGPIISTGGPMPVWTPPTILPPPIVPPVPQAIFSGPGGTIYALPGNASTPGSPFAPPDASQLAPVSAVPISSAAAAAAATDAAATSPTSAFSDWFNTPSSYFGGVPNGYVALGGAAALYLFSRKGKK